MPRFGTAKKRGCVAIALIAGSFSVQQVPRDQGIQKRKSNVARVVNALNKHSMERKSPETDAAVSSRCPSVADLDVGPLDCRPRDAVSSLFLTRVTGMSFESVIECLSVDILGVTRQRMLNGWRQIRIRFIGHPSLSPFNSHRSVAAAWRRFRRLRNTIDMWPAVVRMSRVFLPLTATQSGSVNLLLMMLFS